VGRSPGRNFAPCWLIALLPAVLLAVFPAVASDGAPPDAAASAGDAASHEQALLGLLLDRLDAVARLYADTALRFTCRETITSEPGGVRRFDYIYIFGPDGRFRDYRTRPGSRRGREVDPEHAHLPRWLNQAYSWAFIFWRDRHDRFRFRRDGEETILGREAFRLRFEPVLPIDRGINDWVGTAWIDRTTWQILRVEARTPDDFDAYLRFQASLAPDAPAGLESDPTYFSIETIETEFAFVKNDMRFPSAVVIERSRYAVPGRHGRPFDVTPRYRVRQEYDDYHFFNVRTADEIHALVSGPAAGTAKRPVPGVTPCPGGG
jgi:hypothetical protein